MRGGTGDDLYLVSTADVVAELIGEGSDTFLGAKTDIGVAAYATSWVVVDSRAHFPAVAGEAAGSPDPVHAACAAATICG